jgi:transcription elongation factor Elf1
MDYNTQPKITRETYDPKIHVAEIKRTCNQCGKVWHSLASREAELVANMGLAACGSCGTCGSPHQAQYNRNVDANSETLHQATQCTNCKSSDYKEEVIYYEKRK